MAARNPVPRGSRTILLLTAAAVLLLGLDYRPVDAHMRQAALKCQSGTCTEVGFRPYATLVPLTVIHQFAGLGNKDQAFKVALMDDWNPPGQPPQISLCRGPGTRDHIWGIDNSGNVVYARQGSMLQYSYDGDVGSFKGPKTCDNPTYPGPVLATVQGAGNTAFLFRNSVGRFHPLNFAVDPRLYTVPSSKADMGVKVTKNTITYTPVGAGLGVRNGDVPAVVHVHGGVVPSEYDGVPFFTLTKEGDTLLHQLKDISNPPAMALYHDHAWGFTRLTVYAGAVSGFLVKENPEINKDQPKPTKACVPPIDPKNSPNCGFPEIGAVAVPAQKPSYSDIRDITLVIADKALVAPSPRNPGSIFAELGYPVGQRGGCNSCTPPGADLNANNDTCTSATFGSACPATFDNTTGYCGRWSPEFFGYNNVVNGQVAPVLTVPTGGWYRLRLVNGANTRAYQLVFQADNVVNGGRDLIGESSPLCYKIATEAGYTRKPLTVASPLKMLPAERVELLCDFRFKDLSPTDTAVNYTVKNDDPTPGGNPGQKEVMKISIVPGLKVNVSDDATPLTTNLNPNQPLATIPPLATLYGAQSVQVVKHVMLMERTVPNPDTSSPIKTCSQGMAVSECRTEGVPPKPSGATDSIWGVPSGCLENGMPRNMFADGVPLTCKEGLIEKWIWYNPTADEHPWHWHLNHVQCDNENELKETVPIPRAPDSEPYKDVLTCYVACADAQYILNSGEAWWKNPVDTNAAAALAVANGIADGYDPKTGPGANDKQGICSSTNTSYNNWDYVTHCHILEHEEYDMMAKFRILPKEGCSLNY